MTLPKVHNFLFRCASVVDHDPQRRRPFPKSYATHCDARPRFTGGGGGATFIDTDWIREVGPDVASKIVNALRFLPEKNDQRPEEYNRRARHFNT